MGAELHENRQTGFRKFKRKSIRLASILCVALPEATTRGRYGDLTHEL